MIDVTVCETRDQFAEAFVIDHYFGGTTGAEWVDEWLKVFDVRRMHAASDDGRVVGGAGAFSFELTVPGGVVPAAGVTVVGVLPTHRRRGVLTALMRAQLDDVRARGEPVAILFASEATIYGRFGYGLASVQYSLDLPRERTAFAVPVERRGSSRIVDADEALELFPRVYDRVVKARPGMFARSNAWWQSRLLADQEWRRRGGGALQRVVLEVDGEPAAYALYRLQVAFEHGSSTTKLRVIEALGATPEAEAEIWRLLLDVDWIETIMSWLLPVDHPLVLLLAEPRRAGFRLGDALWLRLVDVEAAFAARGLRGGEPVVVEVEDRFCPWNEGRWRLVPDGAVRTDEPAELRLDAAALASVYLGGFTLAQLQRAGRVEEAVPGGLERADLLLGSDVAPWCPEIF